MEQILSFEPTPEQFGVLWRYLKIPTVTDVDFNGRQLWITDVKKGRYIATEQLDEAFISAFTHNISNSVNRQFNKANKVLEADTRELRISIIHDSVACSRDQYLHQKVPLSGA